MAASSSYLTPAERFKVGSEQWDEWPLLCRLRVAAPGIVQSFDATKQTVTVQLAVRENVVQNAVVTPVAIDILQDIPIFMPRAGGFLLTLPVKQGDECLVIFGDNCIDAWWQSGGIQNQVERRRHDLSDGFAIIGPWSQPRVVSNYSTTSAQLRSEDGNTMVEIAPSGVVNVKCATANVNATSQANITAPTIDLNGNVVISGNLSVGGTFGATGGATFSNTATFNGATSFTTTTTIQGKQFLLHEHTGVQTGGGTSGPVA
jgi:hypothetical protein